MPTKGRPALPVEGPLRAALILFDIDGTLIRRAGPHHREALIAAIRRVTGRETTTDGVPVGGMLDRDIVACMLRQEGAKAGEIRASMPEIVKVAQRVYVRSAPDLQRKVCPGVRRLLARLSREGHVLGLVTGNLTGIAWKKMRNAGLAEHFRFGAFAEMGRTRADLAKQAIRRARKERWIGRAASITLIGDHPNDVHAARSCAIRSIAVATGPATMEDLTEACPDILLTDLRALLPEMLC